MKGIILAGGSGTRLYPMTLVTSKQLLPVYDKPMIYYPLSTLMLAGIRDILIITTPEDSSNFSRLLGDGHRFGVEISYAVQPSPDGLAQAFIIGKDFIGGDACTMILGDNIFYGNGLSALLTDAANAAEEGVAGVLCYYVNDPKRYGIIEVDDKGNAVSIEEKPECPKSNYAVTGMYFFPSGVSSLAEKVRPSARNELEITSLIEMYINEKRLRTRLLGRGFAWLDTGTVDSLVEASEFVRIVEKRQGIQVSAPEEIAFRKGWISTDELISSAQKYGKSPYGEHLLAVAKGNVY